MIARTLVIWTVSSLAASTAAGESFRCGRWIVSEDLAPAEIRQKCGEPDHKTVETTDVYGPSDATGRGSIKRGTTTTERWIYARGSRAARMIVTIVDGKVRSIERER
jgi:hypothetical protein